jgi:CheY-like chemotaxis protein
MELGQLSEDSMQIGIEPSRAMDSKRILVVETDEIVRSALQFMLRDENETHALASLKQAYATGRAWKPDLVLLGLAIVQEQGLQVLGDIAARLPGAKILLVADSPNDPLAQACLASGAHGVLGKPIAIESVRTKVDVLLGPQKPPMIPLGLPTTAFK